MREPDVSGPVTGAALTALWRLLSSGAVGAAAVGAVSARGVGQVRWFLFCGAERGAAGAQPRLRLGCNACRVSSDTCALNARAPPPPHSATRKAEAINAVVDDTTQCKFEAASPAGDEVVLFNILQVCD